MLHTSPYPDLDIPNLDLPTFVFSHAKRFTVYGKDPKLVALVDGAQSLSFAELEAQTEAFASGLYNKVGLRRGDILAAILPNTILYQVVAMGTHMIGGVVTTANPAYTPRELAHQLQVTQAKVVVTVRASIPVVKEALRIGQLSIPDDRILTIDGEGGSVRQVLSQQPFPRVFLTTKHEADTTPSFIVFSSGTSGVPKGVVLSHKNMVANMVQFLSTDRCDKKLMEATRAKFQRRWLQVLPMFHIYGILISNVSILSGGVNVIMEKFDFSGFCALIQEHKIDTVFLAPPVILALTKSPEVKKYDLSSLLYLNSGAAPLSKELQGEAELKLGAFVTQGFGMSESSPLVARSVSGSSVLGSVGPLVPNTVAKFADDNGIQVGVNQIGELCVKGPQIMIGYYNNEQATAKTVSSDGFLHTGDIGYIDSNGNIFITDRKKELIKYKGFQIPPAELEGLLTDHSAVVDAAVIPVYDEKRASEVPKAFIVVRPDAIKPNVGQEVREWMDARVVDYKKLRGGIELIEAIPKSATGKILRRVLKDMETMRSKQAPRL
ncbi:hypothetical protein H4R26_004110 [Coemansia thaxteri]|uniref:Uncharacterized protein n=1 Tax=Coemansia thaxteri TaxID=2663907 RepID=A0A9W8BHS4_9FUNG|nr:hypothetical protein H4R26_004110 [Coemansia thaxteri]